MFFVPCCTILDTVQQLGGMLECLCERARGSVCVCGGGVNVSSGVRVVQYSCIYSYIHIHMNGSTSAWRLSKNVVPADCGMFESAQ